MNADQHPEVGMSLNRATPEQVLAAAEVELARTLKRLIAFQNRLYRETRDYSDDLGAAIQRLVYRFNKRDTD